MEKTLTPTALAIPDSPISEIADYGRDHPGTIPLWTGEGDLPTPPFISEAATRSLAAGETFYTWQRGIPELRQALARYHEKLYDRPSDAERFHVTAGGMHALQIALRMVLEPGDELVLCTPAWTNIAAAVQVGGATPISVPLRFGNRGWMLDLDRFEAAITPKTRAMFINSPSNPTGWTATTEELAALLDIARRHGMWIIADEVYTRFVYGEAPRAPSFHDLRNADDRVMFINTFSKNWAMTGWRIGWLEADPSLGGVIENLIQYSNSGVAAFMQRAAIAALDRGEGFVAHQIARAKTGRDIITKALRGTGRVRFAEPEGAFYLFAEIDGFADTRELAIRLVDEAGVGITPGIAFGPGGESFMRLCFARGEVEMQEAANRLVAWLEKVPAAKVPA